MKKRWVQFLALFIFLAMLAIKAPCEHENPPQTKADWLDLIWKKPAAKESENDEK